MYKIRESHQTGPLTALHLRFLIVEIVFSDVSINWPYVDAAGNCFPKSDVPTNEATAKSPCFSEIFR
jgi:hypothetical protein